MPSVLLYFSVKRIQQQRKETLVQAVDEDSLEADQSPQRRDESQLDRDLIFACPDLLLTFTRW